MDGNISSQINQSQSAPLTNGEAEYLKMQLEKERKMTADLRKEIFDIRSNIANEREKQKESKYKEKGSLETQLKFQKNDIESLRKRLVESNKQNAVIKKELSDLKFMAVVVNDYAPTQQTTGISTMAPLKSSTIALPHKNRINSRSLDTNTSNSITAHIAVENKVESIQNKNAPTQSPREVTKSQSHGEIIARRLPGQMSACKVLFPLLEDLLLSINNLRVGLVVFPSLSNIYASSIKVCRPKETIPLISSVFTPISKQSIDRKTTILGSFADKISTNTIASGAYMPKIQEIIIKILEIFRFSLDDCYNEKFPVALLARYLTDISNILLRHAPSDNFIEGMKRGEKNIKSSDIQNTNIINVYDKFDPVMHTIRFINGALNRLDSITRDIYAQQNSSDFSLKANLDLSKFRDVSIDSHKRKHDTLDSSTVATSNDHFRVEFTTLIGAKVLTGFDMPTVSNVELRMHYIVASGSIPKVMESSYIDVATNLPEHYLDNFEDLPSTFVDLAQDILGEIYYSIAYSGGIASGKSTSTINSLLNETLILLSYLLLNCNFCKISDFMPLVKLHDGRNLVATNHSDSIVSLDSLTADQNEPSLQFMYPFVMSLLTDDVCFNTVNMSLKTRLLNILALMVNKHDSLYDAFAESQIGQMGYVIDEEAESDNTLFIDALVIQGLEIITNFTWYPDKLLDNSVCADLSGTSAYILGMHESVSYLLEIVTFITLLLESYGGKAVAVFFGIKFDENQMELDGSGSMIVFNIHTCSDQDLNRISKSNFVYNICKIWTLAIKYCDGIRNEAGAGYRTKIDQVIIQIVIYCTKILYNIARSVAEGNWHILSRICNEMLYAQLYRFANRQVPTALSECIDYIESVDDIQILYCS